MTKDLHMKRAKLTQGNARACASHGARAAAQVPNGVRILGFARIEDCKNNERLGTQQVRRGVALPG